MNPSGVSHFPVLESAAAAAAFILMAALCLAFLRLVRGPNLPDRVVALDMIVLIIVGSTAGYAVFVKESVFLSVAIVLTLINFLASVAIARYLERRAL